MRWVLLLALLTAAGAGAWWFTRTERPTADFEQDFVLDVTTGDVVPKERVKGLGATGIEPVGIVGKATRPRESLGDGDRWMTAPLDLPRTRAVTGKDLLKAFSVHAPVRFRTQAEWDRFQEGSFELGTDEGVEVHGHIFEDLAGEMGYRVEVKRNFVFVYDPENDDAFRKQLLTARERGEAPK